MIFQFSKGRIKNFQDIYLVHTMCLHILEGKTTILQHFVTLILFRFRFCLTDELPGGLVIGLRVVLPVLVVNFLICFVLILQPQTPTKLVEDLTEIMKKEQDSDVSYRSEVSVS